MVGPGGLEPLTSSVSRKRSNQLSYGPVPATASSLARVVLGKVRLTIDAGRPTL